MAQVTQISVGGFDNNFSYLVSAGKDSKEAILIDPTGDLKTIENKLKELKLKVVYEFLTHNHPDHVELAKHFKENGAKCFTPQNKPLGEVEVVHTAGLEVKIFHTPGHTRDSCCILIGENLFSGDTLFVKGVGTTAYGGNDAELEESLAFLSTLDKKFLLWSGHNYGGTTSTLGEALENSHLKPNKKMLDLIRKKVKEYESHKGKKTF